MVKMKSVMLLKDVIKCDRAWVTLICVTLRLQECALKIWIFNLNRFDFIHFKI